MTTIYQGFDASPTALTISLDSLADGSGVNSNAVDNSSARYGEIDLEVKLTGTSGSTGVVNVFLLRSVDNSDFSDNNNGEFIDSIVMNGTSQVIKTMRVLSLSKHYKIRVVNASGGALASSGNSIDWLGVRPTDT